MACGAIAANSQVTQELGPITNVFSCAATHNKFATAICMWDPERCRQETRFDINGILEERIKYDTIEDALIGPVLRWMMFAIKTSQRIDRDNVDPNDITGPALDGKPRESDAPNQLLYQQETLAKNCLQGVNRTAFACAVVLLACYEETGLTVIEVMDYLIALRPVFEFRSHRDRIDTKALHGRLWRGMNGRPNGKFHFVCRR